MPGPSVVRYTLTREFNHRCDRRAGQLGRAGGSYNQDRRRWQTAGQVNQSRRAEADGAAAAAVIEAGAAAIAARQVVPLPAAGPAPDMLYICVDGTGVPVIAAETQGRDGKAGMARPRTARPAPAMRKAARYVTRTRRRT